MKIIGLLLFINLVGCGALWAQASAVIRIKGRPGSEKLLPMYERYRYDSFRPGRVLYVNNTTATAPVNYNTLLSEMQFIDNRNDTLAFATEPLVKLIAVGNDLFQYDRKVGYLEILTDYDGLKLAVKQGLKSVRNEREGGYAQSSGASAIRTYRFYSSGNASVNQLENKGDILLTREKKYYLIDANNRVYPASKASFQKLFAKNKAEVNAYLARESVTFNEQESLQKLLQYLSDLP